LKLEYSEYTSAESVRVDLVLRKKAKGSVSVFFEMGILFFFQFTGKLLSESMSGIGWRVAREKDV